MKRLKTSRSFKKEFRKQLRFAITAAIGFTIAYSWRNAIFDSVLNFVSQILNLAPSHFTTELYTAFLISILGVLCIFITSKLLKEN